MFDIIDDLIKYINHKPSEPVTVTWSTAAKAREDAYDRMCKRFVKAQEQIDNEKDPVRKKRMQRLYDLGVTDFSDIDD